MPELPKKPKEPILFAAVPFKCEDDEVFVELHPSNTEMGFDYERKKQSELTPDDEVIKCIICGKPASQIDHHFPWEIHDNRCKQHRHSLIDEYVYDQYGCGVEVCKDHYRVLSLVSSMTSVADWLMKHPENPDAEPLRQKKIAFKQELDKFMAKQWPAELFGPMKEDKEPDKSLGGTKMIAVQFLGANASHVADTVGGSSVSLPAFGIMQLRYKGVNYILHSGDVVVRHCDGTIEILTDADFHHKHPALELDI